MKKSLNYINFFAPFIVILLLVKALTLCMIFFLPKVSIEKYSSKNTGLRFRNFEISKSFGLHKVKKKIVKIKVPTYSLQDLMLQAIYKDSQGGVIVVVDKKSRKTVILAMSENYKDYKLIKIYPKYVIFLKDGKRYTLKLYKDVSFKDNEIIKEVSQEAVETVAVSQKDIKKYTTNFNDIWKNIAIKEVKKKGKITGFKVNYVRKNSPFGRLGLKKGDVITKINSEPLTSYAQAFRIYKNVQTYSYLTITILRDGKERDFDYEIR